MIVHSYTSLPEGNNQFEAVHPGSNLIDEFVVFLRSYMREIVRKGLLLVDYLLWLMFRRKECLSCPALLPQKMKDIIGCVEVTVMGMVVAMMKNRFPWRWSLCLLPFVLLLVVMFIFTWFHCFFFTITCYNWSPLSLFLPLLLCHIVLFTCNYPLVN